MADGLPEAQPITRYQKMLENSPFGTSTAPTTVPTGPPAPPWSEDFAVTGVMSMAMGSKYVATVSRKSDNSRFTLETGVPSPQGIELVSVQWSDSPGQTRVTVKKGTEFGTLVFDQAATKAAPSAPLRIPPAPTPPPPGTFIPPGSRPVPGRPGLPTPPPPLPQSGAPLQPLPGAPGAANNGFPRPRPIVRSEPNAPAVVTPLPNINPAVID